MKKRVLLILLLIVIPLFSYSVSAVMVPRYGSTLGVKDVWVLGWGFFIELKSIDESVSPPTATIVLRKEGSVVLDEKTIELAHIYNFYNYSNLIETRLSPLHHSSQCGIIELSHTQMSSDIIGGTTLPDLIPMFSSSSSKTLTVGESWTAYKDYSLSVQAIDARAQPRQAWITLTKGNRILDEAIVEPSQLLHYYENSTLLMTLNVTSIFEGTVPMVQLDYKFISPLIDVDERNTAENWICDEWSACANDTQTRKCKDTNSCGTTFNKPPEIQICSAQPCVENWQCESWGSCVSDIQERICKDMNLCGTMGNKPSTKQNCSSQQCTEDWECGSWSSCSDSYQTRDCKDKNNCGTLDDKPAAKQACGAQSCTENWKCKDWGDCADGIQKRVCKDLNFCGTSNNKPTTKQTCTTQQIANSYIQNEAVYIERKNDGTAIIKVADGAVETSLEIIERDSKIYVKICGKEKEINILPQEAVKYANIDNAEEIRIVEDACKAVYVIYGTKKGTAEKIKAKVDVESGKIIVIEKQGQISLYLTIGAILIIISALAIMLIIHSRKSQYKTKKLNSRRYRRLKK